jgi:hypothetical protein
LYIILHSLSFSSSASPEKLVNDTISRQAPYPSGCSTISTLHITSSRNLHLDSAAHSSEIVSSPLPFSAASAKSPATRPDSVLHVDGEKAGRSKEAERMKVERVTGAGEGTESRRGTKRGSEGEVKKRRKSTWNSRGKSQHCAGGEQEERDVPVCPLLLQDQPLQL